jgi:hypothetical protein
MVVRIGRLPCESNKSCAVSKRKARAVDEMHFSSVTIIRRDIAKKIYFPLAR